MKTPIQEIIGLLKSLRVVIDEDAEKDLLNNEKQFAKECFEAGRAYQNAEVKFSTTGEQHNVPNFYEFYNQFE